MEAPPSYVGAAQVSATCELPLVPEGVPEAHEVVALTETDLVVESGENNLEDEENSQIYADCVEVPGKSFQVPELVYI